VLGDMPHQTPSAPFSMLPALSTLSRTRDVQVIANSAPRNSKKGTLFVPWLRPQYAWIPRLLNWHPMS